MEKGHRLIGHQFDVLILKKFVQQTAEWRSTRTRECFPTAPRGLAPPAGGPTWHDQQAGSSSVQTIIQPPCPKFSVAVATPGAAQALGDHGLGPCSHPQASPVLSHIQP
jgi:hypothetical protein